MNKGRDTFDEIIYDKKLWEFASHPDAAVRRSVFRLLNHILEEREGTQRRLQFARTTTKFTDVVPSLLPVASSSILYRGLTSNQTGSALEYSKAISLLTVNFPEAWETFKKRPKISHIIEYLKRGSQGGPPEVWSHIATFLVHLPEALFPPALEDSIRLLQGLQEGFRRKEEPKTHLPLAWSCYFQVASSLLNRLPAEPDQRKLVEAAVLPIFEQYIRLQASSEWSSGQIQLSTCMSAMEVVQALRWDIIADSFETEWLRITQLVLDRMDVPGPGQSEKPHSSQEELTAEGGRWVSLCKGIRQTSRESVPIMSLVDKSVVLMLDKILSVLRRGSGKEGNALRLPGLI